jgi:hypothetical protein
MLGAARTIIFCAREIFQRGNVPTQRCTVHKHRNLLANAPERLHDEITADYYDMMYADTPQEIQKRRKEFLRKWRLRHPAVATARRTRLRHFHFPPTPLRHLWHISLAQKIIVRAAPNMNERDGCSSQLGPCALGTARVEGGGNAAHKMENMQLAGWRFVVRFAACGGA